LEFNKSVSKAYKQNIQNGRI